MPDDPAPHPHGHPPTQPGEREQHRHTLRRGRRLRLAWLRHSAIQRLVGAGVAMAVLWAAVFWALP